MNGGEIIGRVLRAQGVRFLFTLCGGHISPILVGCKAQGIRVVDTRHEATAVFAADAVARLTGIPGVAAVTAGPGLTNTLTAVQNARLAQSPLVLLGGATATVLRGRGALQDIDQMSLIRSSVKWAAQAKRVRDLEPLLRRALRVAAEGTPGPVFLECPVDLLYDEALVRQWYVAKSTPRPGAGIGEHAIAAYLRLHLNRQFAQVHAPSEVAETITPPSPQPSDVAAAAQRIATAQRPLMVIGSQAMLDVGAVSALRAAVEQLGIPVYLSGMARGLLGANHPLQMRHKRRDALRAADLVILAGVPCDFRLDYGAHIRPRTPVVAVNRNRHDLRLNRRPQVGAVTDASAFLRAVAQAAPASVPDRTPWFGELRERDTQRESEISAQAVPSDSGVNPLALCKQIDGELADDSMIVADGGDFVATASYILSPRDALSWLDPGVFGTLGVGAGFALAAKLCRPETELWTLFGDGALGYSLMEFDTFVRHGIGLVAVVGNDACWSQIAREQVEVLKDDVGCPLRPSDYHAAAEGLGAKGLVIRNDGESAAVLRSARELARAGQPVLVNALLGGSDFRKGSISM
ncbi:thiamine pyrophosphate-binding protein [Sinimarinibacterium sp. CAU 1509]|uniref:thiamine pyrophosphate-binding protein n=1 Tax=Sinimarinibacterium sp. CAU 1509 TaxID=2562283 RepID=UPI0010AC5FCC|nr:thiamine pyrophosphate-binding protein [Sinimarinibacterium sp. CAU 1509]TJY61003.1 thiamine pyrophosphate-binding protein [Sinimarinibacterium sp. CAU 1509]